ncbi:MAG: radical SAM protein [Eubacteriales bacterium]|nr:radical SAM protein [Eubacteriales bacterium]
MYYYLNENFILRGWKGLTCVLIRRPDNARKMLSEDEFSVLMLCDGVTPFDKDELWDRESAILGGLMSKGFVSESTERHPLKEDQVYRLYENRFVESIFWSVTGRCNYKCRHCYMDAPCGAMGEISTEEAFAIIDEAADCGVLKMDLTGGEPFVRRDFFELVDRINSNGISIETIYTNGRMLNGSVLDEFEKRGMKPHFSISFDGKDWHDWLRGVKGAEGYTLDALKLCKERGFTTDIEYTVHKGNIGAIRETVKLLSGYDVTCVRLGMMQNSPLWLKNAEGNEITTREYNDACLSYIPEYFEDGKPVNLYIAGLVSLHKDREEYEVLYERPDSSENLECHLCGEVRYSSYITPEGRLLPCMPMTASERQSEFPLIKDIGLKAALSDSEYMRYVDARVKDYLAKNAECAACRFKLRCGGGCRAVALINSNDFWGKDTDLCLFWHEGYADKLHEIIDRENEKFKACARD